MAFEPKSVAFNTNECKDLVVVDSSVYGASLGSLPKSDFTGRSIKLIRFDGMQQIILFPYTGTPDSIQDQLVISDYFVTQDYIVTIEVTYNYLVASIPTVVTYSFDYISTCYIDVCYANTSLDDCNTCGTCGDSTLCFLAELDTDVKFANILTKFGNLIKAQSYIDRANRLCSSTSTCSC